MTDSAENDATCQRRPHYGQPCECEARLALVVTHTRTSTGGFGPDYCAECSQAISEWVPWPCEATRPIPPAERDEHTPGCRDWMDSAPGRPCVCRVAKDVPDDY